LVLGKILAKAIPLFTAIWLVLGLVALTVGAEVLVRGASQLAARMGISALVIGLTIVAFGTSAPELVVSLGAALKGQVDVAIGNVVGSNLCNILLILGLAASIAFLPISRQLLRFDLPLLILVTGVTWALCLDQNLSRLEGLGLFLGVVAYTAWSVLASRWKTKRENAAAVAAAAANGETIEEPVTKGWWGVVSNSILVAIGLVLLTNGADWFVDSATEIAQILGVPQLVIGLTVVAVGTSLPELATTVVAAIRGERDIAVGNVIGSNLFNLLCVLGVSAAVSGDGISITGPVLSRDIPLMFGITLLCVPVFWTGLKISRMEGLFFLALYIGYMVYLGMSGQPLET
jgi:cation:H+ antiporter